jgi:hypothetical protein
VTFHYKNDKKRRPQFGLIAEEAAQVDSNLVARDKDGKPYSVRYDQVNAMLLNEFLKEHKKVETQQTRIESQEETIAGTERHEPHQIMRNRNATILFAFSSLVLSQITQGVTPAPDGGYPGLQHC